MVPLGFLSWGSQVCLILIASCSSVLGNVSRTSPFTACENILRWKITHIALAGKVTWSTLTGSFLPTNIVERRAEWAGHVGFTNGSVKRFLLQSHSLTPTLSLRLSHPPCPFLCPSLSLSVCLCLWTSLFWGPPPHAAGDPALRKDEEGWQASFPWKQWLPLLIQTSGWQSQNGNYTTHTAFKGFCGAFHVRCSY